MSTAHVLLEYRDGARMQERCGVQEGGSAAGNAGGSTGGREGVHEGAWRTPGHGVLLASGKMRWVYLHAHTCTAFMILSNAPRGPARVLVNYLFDNVMSEIQTCLADRKS